MPPPRTTSQRSFEPAGSSPTTSVDPVFLGCYNAKGCYGDRDGCIEDGNCKQFVSYKSVDGGQKIEFELRGRTDGYVAVGISKDLFMGGDAVVECVRGNDGRIDAHVSWNIDDPKKSNRRSTVQRDIDTVSEVSGRFEDGILSCRFKKDARFSMRGIDFDLNTDEYYILLASGYIREGNIGFHTNGRYMTGQTARLTSVSPVGTYDALFVRLHGAFMIGAWIGAASCGILLARYYKKTWVGSQCCGKDMWYVFHRFFMVLTWSLTMAGFVLIFLELQGWTFIPIKRNPHALLGCITTGLCFLNPFMALIRPAPDGKYRWVFNWSHWFVGNGAQIVGFVAIFYAIELQKAQLPFWFNWLMVAFIAFHVVMNLLLSLQMFNRTRKDQQQEVFAMREMGMPHSPYTERKSEPKGGFFRRSMLALYLLINWIITGILIAIVVLAPIEDHLTEWGLI